MTFCHLLTETKVVNGALFKFDRYSFGQLIFKNVKRYLAEAFGLFFMTDVQLLLIYLVD